MPNPTDPEWVALHAPFVVEEAEGRKGVWAVKDKYNTVLSHGESKQAADFIVSIWNDDAARWWMQAP